jgi:hypothetical protein
MSALSPSIRFTVTISGCRCPAPRYEAFPLMVAVFITLPFFLLFWFRVHCTFYSKKTAA